MNVQKQYKSEGKFVDLPGAEVGKVIVRFPPEASGYLHVGHAKAALLNQHYKQHFNGKLIMRFDDTNPAKEKEEYEKVILEDLKLLKVEYDHFSRTSDHFDTILKYCEKLLKDDKAYVDDTDSETMKVEREAKQNSKNRNNSYDKNWLMWLEMKKGSELGQKCAVRAKINMQSDNGCMRDPTIYRCKNELHPITKDKFKVYPTYDFACPIVDSIEGVTHALRTTEYADRDDQFNWFIQSLDLRKPYINSYARLNLTNTVMSKRKLAWLVDKGYVDGWNDPRMPTVRGILRRGLTVEALKEFIVAQGSSRSVVFMEWDKIWAINKKVIDPVAPRFTTIDYVSHVPVYVTEKNIDVKTECALAQKHPKDKEIGFKRMWKSPTILIDQVDAECLKEGENTTFINWGNLIINKIVKDNERVISVYAETNLNDTNYKKTLKLTWLAKIENEPSAQFTPTRCVYYNHIISKQVLQPNDNFEDFVTENSKLEIDMLGDPELRNLDKGDIIQLQRRGYFIVDESFKNAEELSKQRPVRLIAIPDGTLGSYGPPTKLGAKMSGHKISNIDIGDVDERKQRLASSQTERPQTANNHQLKETIVAQEKAIEWMNKNSSCQENISTAKDILNFLKQTLGVTSAITNDSISKTKESKAEKLSAKKKEHLNANSTLLEPQKNKSNNETTEAQQKQTRLGLESKKSENLAEWYSQIITKAELLEYYDVSGCYIIRPWAYAIWESIQSFINSKIKKLGVENCYFPMFVSQSALEREKSHIADFAPEVAWVTKSGDSDMAEPVAIRPTSETVMYPAYAKWIKSYRDLPLKLNQWNNVVRWEFKHPQPFLRTREFLWQEGHSAFANQKEAENEVHDILEIYRQVYENILAVPVICGKKTEKEKFAGGDYTMTTEAYITAAGRAIQGATSHHLGQNFSKMFDIVFEDPDSGEKRYPYQNSWGLTTRTLGVLVMVHGDDKGIVLPPNVASIQVVITPCGINNSLDENQRNGLYAACKEYEAELRASDIRVYGDYRENYSPGWKYNHWELKGVPIRIELGPRDIKSKQFISVRRDSGEKITMKSDGCAIQVNKLLCEIQDAMFKKAKDDMNRNISLVEKWDDFKAALKKRHMIHAPFCGKEACEDLIKNLSRSDVEVEPGAPSMGAKSLCIPSKQPKALENQECVSPNCIELAKSFTLFGRSY